MKIVAIGFVILVFNVMMSGISGSDIFGSATVYYDNTIIETYQEQQTRINASSQDETQQRVESSNVLDILYRTLSWNWVNQYIPDDLEASFSWFVTGLNVLTGFLMGVGLIELFWRRTILES